MAYNEQLAERIEQLFVEKKITYYAKKMFGGLCFMVNDKMCLGIVKDELMARIGPEGYQEALAKEHCKEMNFTGRSMKGYVYIEPEGVDMDEDLDYWLQRCLDFNPLAKASKKKKTKNQ